MADSTPNATDAAQKLADEHGLDLSTVDGTGADGNILLDDVKSAIATAVQADAQRRGVPSDAAASDDAPAEQTEPEPGLKARSGDDNEVDAAEAARLEAREGDLLPPSSDQAAPQLVVYTMPHAGSTVGRSGKGYSYGKGSVIEAVDGELDHVAGVVKTSGSALPQGPAPVTQGNA